VELKGIEPSDRRGASTTRYPIASPNNGGEDGYRTHQVYAASIDCAPAPSPKLVPTSPR